MGMIYQILNEAWAALRRNRTRSALTMLGVVWGIATVTLLIAYGGSFREILVGSFNAFGKGAVICWPQQTSEQPGGQRAGKKVLLEKADVDMIKETATYVRHACLETVRRPGIAYGDRMVGTAPVRNRIKRLLREAFRLHPYDLPRGYDLVIVVRPVSYTHLTLPTKA